MLICVPLVSAFLLSHLPADDTWKQPLSEKAQIIEKGIQKRHNILGLYPSMVQIPFDSDKIDITTRNPMADIQHAVCWSSNYLAGASYRYAYLKKTGADPQQIAAARKRADEIFEAVYRCQRVTGVKGLQARGYFLGHGETYAERKDLGKLPFWRQGEVDGQDFRWVGDPSHHNYSDAIHGLGQYYTLAAEGKQKDRARAAIDSLVSYWVDNDLQIAKYDTSLPPVQILGLTDGKTLNTRIIMAIAGAKVAHYATGKKKFKKVYDKLIDQYGVRNLKVFVPEKDFDDAEHDFCHLDLLFRIETDPELLAAYRKIADGFWQQHINDAQSLFTYIYFNLAPDAHGKDKALQQALFSLQTFPTDMTVKPRMNSLNPDLKPPYPTYLAAWDNEYIWKSNLLRPDRWLSRIVTDVAVSPEDNMVIYAVGAEGNLYQSRDGALSWRNWRPINQNLTSPVRKVAVGKRSRILMTACDDGFYLTTLGGSQWQKMPIPLNNETPVDIEVSPDDFNVIYAVTDKNVYRSRNFGEEYLGRSWQLLTAELPVLDSPRFVLAHGSPGRVYAVSENKIFTRPLDVPTWTRGADFGLWWHAQTYPWLLADPQNPDHVWVGFKVFRSGRGLLSVIQESQDAGTTWSNDMSQIRRIVEQKGLTAAMKLGVRMELNDLITDAKESGRFYGIADRGILIKDNDSWTTSQAGFNIPLVKSLFVSRYIDWIFAGTPGGLYISKDHGATWQDGNLWLQFEQNTRRELGGGSFIDAYWRARYYGFIDDETAAKPFDNF